MSLTQVEQRTVRINRSQLAVPGSNTRFIEGAAKSDADLVFLDLEDAVAPSEKESARNVRFASITPRVLLPAPGIPIRATPSVPEGIGLCNLLESLINS